MIFKIYTKTRKFETETRCLSPNLAYETVSVKFVLKIDPSWLEFF